MKNKINRWVALLSLVTFFGTSFVQLNAECEYDDCGCAYVDCRTAPRISPQVAVGTIAVVTAVAVALHNRNNSKWNNHYHAHP